MFVEVLKRLRIYFIENPFYVSTRYIKTISEATPLVNKVFSRYYRIMNANKIYDYIERLSNLIRIDSRRQGASFGLQPIQLEALHYLSLCNRYSDTPIAVTEYLGQTKGTVSQTLIVLEKKGYLTKHADGKDKRVTHLKVSADGKKILQNLIPTPLFVNACEQLSDNTQKKVVLALNELLLALLHANNMKSFGVCYSCRYNLKIKDGAYFCKLTQESLSETDIQLICREHEDANLALEKDI